MPKNRFFNRLMQTVENNEKSVGPHYLACEPNVRIILVTLIALYLCHADFPNCQSLSRYGDGALVIKKVERLSIQSK